MFLISLRPHDDASWEWWTLGGNAIYLGAVVLSLVIDIFLRLIRPSLYCTSIYEGDCKAVWQTMRWYWVIAFAMCVLWFFAIKKMLRFVVRRTAEKKAGGVIAALDDNFKNQDDEN